MYKISSIEVDGFWKTMTAKTSFHGDVNIVIGKNGTGKTTFINLLISALTADIDGLYDTEFKTITIRLVDGKSYKTIIVTKLEKERNPFPMVEYKISTAKYMLPLIGGEDARLQPAGYRRRSTEISAEIRNILEQFIAITSLSVHRMRLDPDVDLRERNKRMSAPVDTRLQELMQKLTQYQFELSVNARTISSKLQRDVLSSLLYTPESKREVYSLTFDAEAEQRNLVGAYRQLGLFGTEISIKIQEHIDAVGATIEAIGNGSSKGVDLAPLEARERTKLVVQQSLQAEEKITKIFSHVNQFIAILKEFIPEKTFAIAGGELRISGAGELESARLSSGEKQLLILMTEALLQKQRPYVFVADEPELSLHISWQRSILNAIRTLNPNAQLIVATHSPEIAGRFSSDIIDMEDILSVRV